MCSNLYNNKVILTFNFTLQQRYRFNIIRVIHLYPIALINSQYKCSTFRFSMPVYTFGYFIVGSYNFLFKFFFLNLLFFISNAVREFFLFRSTIPEIKKKKKYSKIKHNPFTSEKIIITSTFLLTRIF